MSEMSQTPTPAPMAPDVNDNDKLMALLAYLISPIVPAIILLSETNKARPYQKYHAVQALGLVVAEFVAAIVLCVVFTICTFVTAGLGAILNCLLFVVYVPQIYYAIIAYSQPKYFEIPVVTNFMIQQKWLTKP